MNKYVKAAQALIDAGETDAAKIAMSVGVAKSYVETLLAKRTTSPQSTDVTKGAQEEKETSSDGVFRRDNVPGLGG